MYARNISFRLKSNMQSDYTRTFENQILPLLHKQKGFKDEITLCNPGSADAISISLWENKSNADDYNTHTYPEVLKTLAKVVDGTPQVHTYPPRWCAGVGSVFAEARRSPTTPRAGGRFQSSSRWRHSPYALCRARNQWAGELGRNPAG